MMMTKNLIFNHLQEHKPIIINFGKGFLSNEDIKETSYYDKTIQKYRSETGIWSNKLIREIVNGEVENTSIEIVGE